MKHCKPELKALIRDLLQDWQEAYEDDVVTEAHLGLARETMGFVELNHRDARPACIDGVRRLAVIGREYYACDDAEQELLSALTTGDYYG